jgi:tetratricopeptide (TPR) repeat protein
VLPKDTPRNQVTALMRTYALALGVRCEHCHVPDPNAAAAPAGGGGRGGGPELDHSLDDKETKKIAREMMKMVRDINEKYLPTTGRTIAARNQVTCETCHHGLPKPRTLRAALAEAVEARDADSAVALYRALRLQYFGSGAYDFSELSLTQAAEEVTRMQQRPAAIAFLKLNLEFFPQSVNTYVALANQHLAAGDTASAVSVVTRGLEAVPQNPQLRNLSQRLGRRGGPPN